MSHNRDLSAAAAQFGFHSSNIGIGSEAPRYPLDIHGGNLLVSGSAAGNLILEDRGVGDSSRPFALLASNDGNFTITSANRNASGTTTSSVERLRIDSSGRLLIGRTSTTHEHPLQVQAASGALAIAIQGRSVDDQSEITFYENDNTTITAQIQQLSNRSIFRHRVGYLRFDAGGTSESMRLDSSGRLLINTDDSRAVMDHAGNGPSGKLQIEAQNSDAIMSIISAGTADANRCGTINLGRHRNSTVGGTATIVQNGDSLGAVVFSGGDGGDMLTCGAKIHAVVDGAPGANDMPGALIFSTTPDGQGHGFNTERLRINSNSQLLHTRTDDTTRYDLEFRNTGGISDGNYGGIHWTQSSTGSTNLAAIEIEYANNGRPDIVFKTRDSVGSTMSEAARIDTLGRFKIASQPGCKVSIDSNGTGGGNNTQTGNTVLPFNSTGYGYNTGNHFNTTNHTFTAPLAGKYLVLLSVNVIGDNIVYIYKNGTANMGGEYRSNPVGPWEHCELCGVIECSANDTIKAHSYLLSTSGGRKFNGGTNPGSYWDTLSIYYLG